MDPLIESFKSELLSSLRKPVAGDFVPSGLQDKVILALSKMEHDHYHIQSFNGLGKTMLWVNIVRQVCAPTSNRYFDCDLFRRWPFHKSIFVITTKENLKEAGAVASFVKDWWPSDLYTSEKNGQHYESIFNWKSGFQVKLFSNEQPPHQFEGPECGMWIMDEPARAGVASAFNTRLKKGGIGMTIFTPVSISGGFNPAPVIDELEDMEARGRKTAWLHFTDIWDNHVDKGVPNRFKEKRGIYTTEQIEKYISGVSTAEYDARIKGTLNVRSGRVYPMFSKEVHCSRDFSLNTDYARSWNNYMVMDPHRAYYPFMLWIGVTPEEDVVVWNEWPTYREFGGNFYDKARDQNQCDYTTEDFSEVIKIFDSGNLGMADPVRFIDPMFARGTQNEWTRSTMGIIDEFRKCGVKFNMPPVEAIDKQRMVLMDLMRWDKDKWPRGGAPRFWVLPHCVNTIRSLERHYFEQGSEKESEEHKDPIDCIRYFLAGIGKVRWKAPETTRVPVRDRSADIIVPKKKFVDDVKNIYL